jgi:hypothetical protein
MEKWRNAPHPENPYQTVLSYAPMPFIRTLADEVLHLLVDIRARRKVSLLVREAMQREWQSHLQLDEAANHILTETLNGRTVWELSIKEIRDTSIACGFGRDGYAKSGWPFPILHGIDTLPGCILIFAGLNELAARDPNGFDPRHESIIQDDELGPTLCFRAFELGWEFVGTQHKATILAVMEAAKSHLALYRNAANNARKAGRPSDTCHPEDKRIWEAWQSGIHRGFKDLARALGGDWTQKKVQLAVGRHRKRITRQTASNSALDE